MSMQHSLEVRCPLLDHRRRRAGVPDPDAAGRCRGCESKHLLRQLARKRLPAELAQAAEARLLGADRGVDWRGRARRVRARRLPAGRRRLVAGRPGYVRRLFDEHRVGPRQPRPGAVERVDAGALDGADGSPGRRRRCRARVRRRWIEMNSGRPWWPETTKDAKTRRTTKKTRFLNGLFVPFVFFAAPVVAGYQVAAIISNGCSDDVCGCRRWKARTHEEPRRRIGFSRERSRFFVVLRAFVLSWSPATRLLQ